MERENFKSRLGFILVSAGCAIGIGNVWRFPYVAGQNGGGLFVLLYLIFLVLLGVPVLTMELAVGRASRKSAVHHQKVASEHTEPAVNVPLALLLFKFFVGENSTFSARSSDCKFHCQNRNSHKNEED